MKMLAVLDKTKPSIGVIRDLHWAAVKRMMVLWLQQELSKIRHDPLYQPGLTEALYVLYVVEVFNAAVNMYRHNKAVNMRN
jgi:hypothetical protein